MYAVMRVGERLDVQFDVIGAGESLGKGFKQHIGAFALKHRRYMQKAEPLPGSRTNIGNRCHFIGNDVIYPHRADEHRYFTARIVQHFLYERSGHDNSIEVFVYEADGLIRDCGFFPEEDDQAHASALQVLDHGVVMNDRQHFPFQRFIQRLAYCICQPLLEGWYLDDIVVRLAMVGLERELALQHVEQCHTQAAVDDGEAVMAFDMPRDPYGIKRRCDSLVL